MATILNVDDNKVARDSIVIFLEEFEGHTCVTAGNGQEALSRLAEIEVDLIISNYQMPRLDGLSLLKHLRGDDAYKKVPIIINSASSTIRKTALAEGANAFLLMPPDMNLLRTLVSGCLRDESPEALTNEQKNIWNEKYQIETSQVDYYRKFYRRSGD